MRAKIRQLNPLMVGCVLIIITAVTISGLIMLAIKTWLI